MIGKSYALFLVITMGFKERAMNLAAVATVGGLLISAARFGKSVLDSQKTGEELTAIKGILLELRKQNDQAITREIKSAFEAISDANFSNNEAENHRLLEYAGNKFLLNTGLEPTLETAGHPNSYWIAISYYGLAYISFLQKDEKLVWRRLLKVFISDPRLARTTLLPDFYNGYLKKQCSDIYSEYFSNKKKAEESNNLKMQQINLLGSTHAATTQAAIIATIPLLCLFLPSVVIMPSVVINRNSSISKLMELEKIKGQVKERMLIKTLHNKIDNRCQEITQKLLDS
jgi:hypothetical protein